MTENPTTTEIIESLRNSGHRVGGEGADRIILDGVDVTGAMDDVQYSSESIGEQTLASAVEYLLWAAGEES